MSGKKEIKLNNKKIGSVPENQRSPNTKQVNKSTVSNNNEAKDGNPLSKIDANGQLATPNRPSPTKISRNQVGANWSSVAGGLKSRNTSNKKIGKHIHSYSLVVVAQTNALFVCRLSFKSKCNCIGLRNGWNRTKWKGSHVGARFDSK